MAISKDRIFEWHDNIPKIPVRINKATGLYPDEMFVRQLNLNLQGVSAYPDSIDENRRFDLAVEFTHNQIRKVFGRKQADRLRWNFDRNNRRLLDNQ